MKICFTFLLNYAQYIKLNNIIHLHFDILRHYLDRLSLPWIVFILNLDSAIN